MKNILACFLDIDGTLVRTDHSLSPAVANAVGRLEKEGVAPIIATGRSYEALLPIKKKLNLRSPVICYNGAMIVDGRDGSVMARHDLPDPEARQVVDLARKEGVHILAYREGKLIYEKERSESEEYRKRIKITGEAVDFDSFLTWGFTKCLIIADHGKLLSLQKKIRELCGDRINVFFSDPRFLEIVHRDVDKGRAVAEVMKLLGGTTGQAMAMGDGFNDLPMLEAAGWGVVMANALPALREMFPPERTAPHVDEDGAARYLASFFGWDDFAL